MKDKDQDVICIAWLMECAAQKRLVPLRPRHYLHMSHASLLVGGAGGWVAG